MGDVLVHDSPEPLNGIEMKAIGRQLDQMNAAVFARQERSDIGAFMVRALSQMIWIMRLSGLRALILASNCAALSLSTVVGSTKGASEAFRFRAP